MLYVISFDFSVNTRKNNPEKVKKVQDYIFSKLDEKISNTSYIISSPQTSLDIYNDLKIQFTALNDKIFVSKIQRGVFSQILGDFSNKYAILYDLNKEKDYIFSKFDMDLYMRSNYAPYYKPCETTHLVDNNNNLSSLDILQQLKDKKIIDNDDQIKIIPLDGIQYFDVNKSTLIKKG